MTNALTMYDYRDGGGRVSLPAQQMRAAPQSPSIVNRTIIMFSRPAPRQPAATVAWPQSRLTH